MVEDTLRKFLFTLQKYLLSVHGSTSAHGDLCSHQTLSSRTKLQNIVVLSRGAGQIHVKRKK